MLNYQPLPKPPKKSKWSTSLRAVPHPPMLLQGPRLLMELFTLL